MTLREAIYGLLEDLNDIDTKCENTTFTLDQIKRYLIEGRCLIQEMNPEFYTEFRTFSLDAGKTQRINMCKAGEIVGQVDCESCEVIGTMCECTSDYLKTSSINWGVHCESGCSKDKCESFKLKCYIWINRAEGIINVHPPVPVDCDVCIGLNCQSDSGDLDLDADIAGCKDLAALMQWALYRASMVDAEDPSSFSAAQIYLNTFASLTMIKLRKLHDKLDKGEEGS